MDGERKTDDELERISSQFLADVREIGRLEEEKRRTARSTPKFMALAEEIEEKSRRLYGAAVSQRQAGEHDSPDAEERADQTPGDWTR